jgi:hypothetical protein
MFQFQCILAYNNKSALTEQQFDKITDISVDVANNWLSEEQNDTNSETDSGVADGDEEYDPPIV